MSGHYQSLQDQIEIYINKERPFGPLDASDVRHPDVAALLFDREIESIRSVFGRNFLVGRRGSGKSSVLNAQMSGNAKTNPKTTKTNKPSYNFIVSLTAWKEFPSIRSQLAKLEQDANNPLPVEWMAEKWEEIFWIYLGREIRKNAKPEHRALRGYKDVESQFGIDPAQAQMKITSVLKEGDNPRSIALVRALAGTPNVDNLRSSCQAFLSQSGTNALITIDSMEDYPIRDRNHQVSLNGMMRAIARINNGNSRVRIIFCLPAEIFSHFFHLSSNPVKDFDSVDYLHWSATGLLQAAAHRYRIFLQYNDPETARLVSDYDIRDRRNLQDFWKHFFPDEVTNGLGQRENALAYIVRHTQLLPRQLFLYLNELAKRSHESTGGWNRFPSELIPRVVASQERLAAREVFKAFSSTYPKAVEACEAALSHCKIEEKYGQLEKVWREHARVYLDEMGLHTFPEFIKMLSALGIIGRASNKMLDSDRYIHVEFEYREKDNLIINETHRICIHPLFYLLLDINADSKKTVYPIGAAIQDDSEDDG